MSERRAILASQSELALVGDAASLGAQAEVLELVVQHLSSRFPSRFKLHGEALYFVLRVPAETNLANVVHASATATLQPGLRRPFCKGEERRFTSILEGFEWRLVDYAQAPLLLVGQIIQEDLCLMREEPRQTSAVSSGAAAPLEGDVSEVAASQLPPPLHIFAAGLVTESFDPVAKHLLPMMELHEPVPRYAEDLAESMDRVFASLRRPVWRANFSFAQWLLEGEDELPEESGDALLQRLFLKVEYETLRRLPIHSDYLVFTIRSHADPLLEMARTPRACAALATELQTLPEALLMYKGLTSPAAKSTVLRFLDSVVPPMLVAAT